MNENMFEEERFQFFQYGLQYTLSHVLNAMVSGIPLNRNPEAFQVPGFHAYFTASVLKNLKEDMHSPIRKYYSIALMSHRTGYPVDIIDLIYRQHSETKLKGIYVIMGQMEIPVLLMDKSEVIVEGSSVYTLLKMWLASRPEIMDVINSAVQDKGGKNASQRTGR